MKGAGKGQLLQAKKDPSMEYVDSKLEVATIISLFH